MAESFSVGEIAFLTESKHWPEFNGEEVTVIGGYQPRAVWANRERTKSFIDARYLVATGDGHRFAVPPEKLRKKRPPREDLTVVSWDSVPWWPEALVRNVKEPEHV